METARRAAVERLTELRRVDAPGAWYAAMTAGSPASRTSCGSLDTSASCPGDAKSGQPALVAHRKGLIGGHGRVVGVHPVGRSHRRSRPSREDTATSPRASRKSSSRTTLRLLSAAGAPRTAQRSGKARAGVGPSERSSHASSSSRPRFVPIDPDPPGQASISDVEWATQPSVRSIDLANRSASSSSAHACDPRLTI